MVKNLFAWASIGSNGKVADDLAGDQTGKEVKIGEYYNFGQKMGYPFPFEETRAKGGGRH